MNADLIISVQSFLAFDHDVFKVLRRFKEHTVETLPLIQIFVSLRREIGGFRDYQVFKSLVLTLNLNVLLQNLNLL